MEKEKEIYKEFWRLCLTFRNLGLKDMNACTLKIIPFVNDFYAKWEKEVFAMDLINALILSFPDCKKLISENYMVNEKNVTVLYKFLFELANHMQVYITMEKTEGWVDELIEKSENIIDKYDNNEFVACCVIAFLDVNGRMYEQSLTNVSA